MTTQTRDTKKRRDAIAPRGALVVFAKEPQPGFVKTRLTPPLSPEQAAAFYRCMLADVLETSAQICESLHLTPILALQTFAPQSTVEQVTQPTQSASPRSFESLPPTRVRDALQTLQHETEITPFRVIEQRGHTLAERMQNALLDLTTNHTATNRVTPKPTAASDALAPPSIVIFRGSDSPALTLEIFESALEKLETTDITLSPDRDGGYNLIAMRLGTAIKNHPSNLDPMHTRRDPGQALSGSHTPRDPGQALSGSHGLSEPERACPGSLALGLIDTKKSRPGLPTRRLQKLFALEMSTANVLEETLAQAQRLGLTAQLLEASFDLDRIEDLRELKNLHASKKKAACPRTLAYAEQNNLWRFLDED